MKIILRDADAINLTPKMSCIFTDMNMVTIKTTFSDVHGTLIKFKSFALFCMMLSGLSWRITCVFCSNNHLICLKMIGLQGLISSVSWTLHEIRMQLLINHLNWWSTTSSFRLKLWSCFACGRWFPFERSFKVPCQIIAIYIRQTLSLTSASWAWFKKFNRLSSVYTWYSDAESKLAYSWKL